MVIVNYKTFLGLPAGTVYQRYNHHHSDRPEFEGIEIKGETQQRPVTNRLFNTTSTITTWAAIELCAPRASDAAKKEHRDKELDLYMGAVMMEGISVPLRIEPASDCGGMEGDLFAIWSKEDVEKLQSVLEDAVKSYT